ncbi:MAG: SulP family inorganic anion transporter [Oscillibacter sp.]
MAGLTVCAVALPLALAFGVSSGASAASGLVTAIIAGVVIAILGGASLPDLGPDGRDERGARRHRRGIRPAGCVFRLLRRGRSAAACGRLQAGSLN